MNPASEYRKRAVEGASPVGLVVLLYGAAITSLMRAIAAADANNIEKRTAELNHVLAVFAELQGTLDFHQGGEVARHLERFYVVMRAQVLEASIKNSKPMLQELVRHMTAMKEAWQQVENETRDSGVTGLAAKAGQQPAYVVNVQHGQPLAATL